MTEDLIQKYNAGRVAFHDLDTAGYPDECRQAIEAQIREGANPEDWQFWHNARLAFLELGGDYKPEFQRAQRNR